MARRGHTNIDSMQDESPLGLQASFIEGLKTEFTGLNFPPNAATDTDNCVFTMLGDVTRRKGFDYELDYQLASLGDRTGAALNTYVWRNAGGDGESILFVTQVATSLYFYVVTDTTSSSPLSNHKLSSTVDLTQYVVAGSARNFECQFADGNGYLFVYNNACTPVYCTYDPIGKTVTSNAIAIKVRDFVGIPESGVDPTNRSLSITQEHEYNLRNQGWTRASLWSVTAQDNLWNESTMGDGLITIPQSFTGNGAVGIGITFGNHTFTVGTNLPISIGTPVDINYSGSVNTYDIKAVQWEVLQGSGTAQGIVKSYDKNAGILVINVTFTAPVLHADNLEFNEPVSPVTYTINSSKSINTIDTFFNEIGLYPGNADIWWIFKDQTDVFNPSQTIGQKGLPSAWAPKGHYILDAFSLDRQSTANSLSQYGSSLTGLTVVSTSKRPTNGTWFQGRVWYTGVDDSQQKTGDQNYYTWTENVYFSRIVEGTDDFSKCHEDNDPTDQYSFNLLPSDGGVITIQGAGAIFRLFPIQNGMLVFAANGIWFITGSQGIGFSANDYTITKISAVRSISSNSFVDVNGLPIFWNEEGIYTIAPAQQGLGLTVNPLTVGTIGSFYKDIPYEAKLLARGSYNPVDYIAQWVYQEAATAAFTTPLFYAFDDSCHMFTSTDLGVTWVESETPSQTMHDDWSDSMVPVNDGDYITVVGFDRNFEASILPGGFSDSSGYVGISPSRGATGSWTMTSPQGASPTAGKRFVSGAATAGGSTILAMPDYLNGNHPRISRDGGSTWSLVQPLGAGDTTFSGRAAFAAGGQVMYMTRIGSFPGIWKSSDAGVTWAVLSNSPHVLVGDSDELRMRLRCSSDGNTVVYSDVGSTNACIYVSKDGGTTWTTHDFGVPQGFPMDFNISLNGQTIFLVSSCFVGDNITQGWLTHDGGNNWTDLRSLLPSSLNYEGEGVGVSTDGRILFVAYEGSGNNPSGKSQVDVSVDGGITWVNRQIDLTALLTPNSSPGTFVSCYVTPQVSDVTPAQVALEAYQFNKVLNYNTHTNAFYPWTISDGTLGGLNAPHVHSVDYIANPGGVGTPDGSFKYFTSILNGDGTYSYTLSDTLNDNYSDWFTLDFEGLSYNSYFVTGYSLFGQGLRKFQPLYLEMFSRLNEPNMKYSIEGLWDFATAGNSGKWSTRQVISLDKPNFGMAFKRHKIRGNGYALQLKVNSVDNSPFDIMGWNMQVTQNAGM